MISLSESCILLLVLLMGWKGFSQTPANIETDTSDLPTIFLPATLYASGEQVWSVAIADMNLDKHLDVIAASKVDGKISIHVNNGKGEFTKSSHCIAQENNRAICMLDANQDGYPDVGVVSLTGRLSVLINDRSGQLKRSQSLQAGVMAHDVIALDLDKDGDQDLITLAVSDQRLRLFTNDGKGRFSLKETVKTGPSPRVIQTGDLNGDGLDELVIGGDLGKLYIHWQKKAGHFQEYSSMRSTAATWGLALGDLNGDGHLDIAASSYHEKQLYIHLNHGDGTFQREQELLSGDHNFDLVMGDIDLDGDLDIATCSTVDKALNIHLNDGRGMIGERQEIRSGDWNAALAMADLDKDGDLDVVLGSINDESIVVHKNTIADQVLRKAKDPCLSGFIYAASDSTRIGQAQVSVQDAKGRSIETLMTQEDGSFRFCLSPQQSYRLVVRAASYPVYRDSVILGFEDVEKDIYLALPVATWVLGKVIDTYSNQPIPNAHLCLLKESSDTLAILEIDDKGGFKHHLPFGKNYEIRASAPGYEPADKQFDLNMAHVAKGKKIILRLTPIRDPLTACISGTIRDQISKDSLPGAQLEIRSLVSGRFKKIQADEQGNYHTCLPFDQYEITTTHPGYFFQHTSLEVKEADAVEGKKQDIFLKPLKVGASIVLKNIYFDVDRATLRNESIAELEHVLTILNENPSMVVEIAGHTDSDATEAYNQTLSQNRSQSVVDYLMASGIEQERLEPIGYGELRPVVPNDSPENKQLNRRTEFLVKSFEFMAGQTEPEDLQKGNKE